MTSVSNAAVGAFLAGNAAAKARHGMNEAIARLSTGVRSMYGGDAAGASVAHTLRADGRSALMAARNVEDGISFLQAGESALLELAALNTRLRELAVQKLNAAFLASDEQEALLLQLKQTAIQDTDFARSSANLAAKIDNSRCCFSCIKLMNGVRAAFLASCGKSKTRHERSNCSFHNYDIGDGGSYQLWSCCWYFIFSKIKVKI